MYDKSTPSIAIVEDALQEFVMWMAQGDGVRCQFDGAPVAREAVRVWRERLDADAALHCIPKSHRTLCALYWRAFLAGYRRGQGEIIARPG